MQHFTKLVDLQILFAYEDENNQDVVAAIDFWKNNRKSEMPPQEKGQGVH